MSIAKYTRHNSITAHALTLAVLWMLLRVYSRIPLILPSKLCPHLGLRSGHISKPVDRYLDTVSFRVLLDV